MTSEILTEIPQSILSYHDSIIAPGFAELNELAKVDGIDKRVIVIRNGEQIEACAVCNVENRRHHGIHLKVYALFGYLLHDYCRILCKSAKAMNALKRAAINDAKQLGCDIIIWNNIPTELVPDGTLPIRTEIKLFTASENEQGWDRFYKSKHVKYLLNKAKKINGSYNVDIIDGFVPDTIMADLAKMHIARWRFAGSGSPFESNCKRIDEYRVNPGNKHYLRIFAGEEIIACHYGMKYGKTLLFHTPIINPKYLDLSPMKLILAETAKYCEAHDLTSIDFGHGDEAYKDGYCTLPRITCGYTKVLTLKGFIAQNIGKFSKLLKNTNFLNHENRRPKTDEGNKLQVSKECSLNVETDNATLIDNWIDFCDLSSRLGTDIYKWQFARFHKKEYRYICVIEENQCVAYGWMKLAETTDKNTSDNMTTPQLIDVWYSSDIALRCLIDKALSISNNRLTVVGNNQLHKSLNILGY